MIVTLRTNDNKRLTINLESGLIQDYIDSFGEQDEYVIETLTEYDLNILEKYIIRCDWIGTDIGEFVILVGFLHLSNLPYFVARNVTELPDLHFFEQLYKNIPDDIGREYLIKIIALNYEYLTYKETEVLTTIIYNDVISNYGFIPPWMISSGTLKNINNYGDIILKNDLIKLPKLDDIINNDLLDFENVVDRKFVNNKYQFTRLMLDTFKIKEIHPTDQIIKLYTVLRYNNIKTIDLCSIRMINDREYHGYISLGELILISIQYGLNDVDISIGKISNSIKYKIFIVDDTKIIKRMNGKSYYLVNN